MVYRRRPCWEGQTRLNSSVFYMLSFHASLKQATVKRTLFQMDKIFSPQIKKHPALRGHILGISEKRRSKLDIFVNFRVNKHFLYSKTIIFYFFDFNLHLWRSATLLTWTLYLLFEVALCNQPTIVFARLKVISPFKPYCTPILTIGFSTVTYNKLWKRVKDLQKNTVKI